MTARRLDTSTLGPIRVDASRPRLVLLESPYAGDVTGNLTYARRALADSLARGEAPIASHALYTQPGVLDDNKPAERAKGIAAGLAWGRVAAAVVFYVDLGWSRGMIAALEHHQAEGTAVEVRELDQVTNDERRRRDAGRSDWRERDWRDHCGVVDCPHCHGLIPEGSRPAAPFVVRFGQSGGQVAEALAR